MASTPSSRLKLTPSNSPFLHRPPRSPLRARAFNDASSSAISPRLSLKRVIGSTCNSPTGFDTVHSSFAYIAGGAVVVVDVDDNHYQQRFYRARPTAIPVYPVSPVPHAPSTPNSTPKANDSRNRSAAGGHRDSGFGLSDWGESPTGKTWTQRERIKSATCLALSRDGRFLAVGETGYAPRVLIFNLDDSSSDTPLVSISEHNFGVTAVAWSSDSRYLASLGTANDGFLYLWKIDPRTGAAKLSQQNRCTSYVRGMIWLSGSALVTFGVRHVKIWRADETTSSVSANSPNKSRFTTDGGFPSPVSQQQQYQQQHKTLPGRNILLGSLLDATFSCAAPLSDGRAIICSEAGDVCILESVSKQMKLVRLRDVGFSVSCVTVREDRVYIGGKAEQSVAIDLDDLLLETESQPDRSAGTESGTASPTSPCSYKGRPPTKSASTAQNGIVAMGFLTDHIVTVDTKQSIDVFSSTQHVPGTDLAAHVRHIPISGHGEPILGVQALSIPNAAEAAFFTWSASGSVLLWSLEGEIKSSFHVPIEQVALENDLDLVNQLSVVRATKGGKLFVTADRLGVLRVMDFATGKFILETKAHASECQSISVYENNGRLLLATSGRDRMAQLFYGQPDGTVEHFQTLEFAAKVVQVLLTPDDKVITCSFDRTLQVHDLVSKEDDPDAIAAIPSRVITLKASPSSMALAPGAKSIYVSLLDRTICQYELATGKLTTLFRCIDEGGAETAVLDSLIYGVQSEATVSSPVASGMLSTPGSGSTNAETSFLLGLSNTDKSVRIYDAQTGAFLDREWGHTEAINGVALVEEEEEEDRATGCRKVVSVGSDGTIMIWSLDLRDPVRPGTSTSRDSSPAKESARTASVRPPLRRVLSKAELAEFQRSSSSASGGSAGGGGSVNGSTNGNGNINGTSGAGRRSPPRTVSRKASRHHLLSSSGSNNGGVPRTPVSVVLNSPTGRTARDVPSRRASAGSGSGSPPLPSSPKTRVRRRPSLPAMNTGAHGGSSGSGATTATAAGGASGSGGNVARKKSSMNNLRNSYGFGSLTMATEQTCRQLRTYRKRLASTDPIPHDVLVELDQELRLTMEALGDRAIRSKAASDELDERLDEKLERLVSMLNEKWRLQCKGEGSKGAEAAGGAASGGGSGRAGKREGGRGSTAATTTPRREEKAKSTPPSRHGRDGSGGSNSSSGSNDSHGSHGSNRSSTSSTSNASRASRASQASRGSQRSTSSKASAASGASVASKASKASKARKASRASKAGDERTATSGDDGGSSSSADTDRTLAADEEGRERAAKMVMGKDGDSA